MKQDNGNFGIIVGGLVALAAVSLSSAAANSAARTPQGDQDLPPIAAPKLNRHKRALTTTLAA